MFETCQPDVPAAPTCRIQTEVGVVAGDGEPRFVARAPQTLTLARHRDLGGREERPLVRWLVLLSIFVLLALGLANVFGQRPQTDIASASGVELEVYSPERLRGGLFFMSRFTIRAQRDLEQATLVLDPGWLEGMTLNTLEPAPLAEANRDGRLELDLGRIRAGAKHVLFLHFQVNPTNVGHRSQDVELHDGETPLLHVDRTVTVFP